MMRLFALSEEECLLLQESCVLGYIELEKIIQDANSPEGERRINLFRRLAGKFSKEPHKE